MKYKNLTLEQIIISLDRLTRFKPVREKYVRVFKDILLSNLIEPRFKKSKLDDIETHLLRDMAVDILNTSIHTILGAENHDTTINALLKEYEENTFYIDKDTEQLLNNNIDYISALKLIPDNSVINLRWLKSLENEEFCDLSKNRAKNLLKFPVEKVLLVEGITEEILLPAFSKFLGFDFYGEGIQIIPAGGKNQVVKMYYKLLDDLKIPIYILLDKDAEENIKQITPKLRGIDKIHLVSCGEFEDLLPKSLIIKAVNSHLHNFASICEEELQNDLSAVKNLELIFKEKGLHEFKKAEFAKIAKDNISDISDVSEEITTIIKEILT